MCSNYLFAALSQQFTNIEEKGQIKLSNQISPFQKGQRSSPQSAASMCTSPKTLAQTNDTGDVSDECNFPVITNSAPVSRQGLRSNEYDEEVKTVTKKKTQQPIRLRGLSMGRIATGGSSKKTSQLSKMRSQFSGLLISSNKSDSSRGSIVLVQSNAEAEQLTLEENQLRCEFFNKYRFDKSKFIGSGSSSSVYKCFALQKSDENLVVKVANDEGDGTKFESVRLESKILGKLAESRATPNSKNLVQLVDYYEDQMDKKINYLVLRNAGEMSLQDLVEERSENNEQINPATSKHLAYQLIKSIKNVHDLKICHRDLKPDNILLQKKQITSDSNDSKYNLTLIDFNIAVDFSTVEIRGPAGLKQWSAPETRSQQTYDQRCDLWGYGCILFYLFSGGLTPFQDAQVNDETITQSLNSIKAMSDKTQTAALRNLITGLWQIDPKNRYTIEQVLAHEFFETF